MHGEMVCASSNGAMDRANMGLDPAHFWRGDSFCHGSTSSPLFAGFAQSYGDSLLLRATAMDKLADVGADRFLRGTLFEWHGYTVKL